MPQSPISKLTPPFSLVPFFWESFNLLVRIKKMVNRTLSLGLYLSRICYLLNFLNLYIPLWLRKFFKFMVFRLLKKAFASQQTKSRHFYSCPLPPLGKALSKVLIATLIHREITHLPRQHLFENLSPPAERGGRKLWS